MKYIKLLGFCLSFVLFFSSCHKDKVTTNEISSLDLEINEFIWGTMHNYYLWVDNVPKLSSSYFSNDDSKVINFLKGYSDHEKLFYDLLYDHGTVDRFSWIVSDYVALEKQFQGVTKSMGYDFQLYRYNAAGDLFGFVHYVFPGSPAENAGVRRGDVFTKINGTVLTVSNYNSLLNADSYYLSYANISNHTIIPNSKTSSNMTSAEVQENPIYFDTIYNVNSIKVGYLVYNGFMDNYDNQLNKVFKYFKDNGINKLILDLRYNPGGSGEAATYLASMIYSTDTTKVFFRTSYNALLNNHFSDKYGPNFFNNYFADKIHASDKTTEEPINSLGLTELYVIATGNSASASELIINGLRPHLSLTFVGDTTYGKYVGSTTFYDEDNTGKINPNHKWALQPIIMKAININGVSDFNNGLFPDEVVPEDLSLVLPFGDINETLLRAALDKIKGISGKKSFISNSFGKVANSKDLIPHSRELYFNNLKKGLKLESFKSAKKN